jgi:hypothetical protein
MTDQPKWKLLANLGDVNPIEYGGYFIFEDGTGVYDPQGEYLEAPDDDTGTWYVYRFDLDRCTLTTSEPDHDGSTYTVLSDNPYHPLHPAWFARKDPKRPQDSGLEDVANFTGQDVAELEAALCSEDVIERAHAYRDIGSYHGFDNLDSYPLTLTRAEVDARYPEYV